MSEVQRYLLGEPLESLISKLNPYTYDLINLLLLGEIESITFRLGNVYLDTDIIEENELTIGGYYLDNYVNWDDLDSVNYIGQWTPEVTLSLSSDYEDGEDEMYIVVDAHTRMTKDGNDIYSFIEDIPDLDALENMIMRLIDESYMILDSEGNEITFVEFK